MVIHRKPAYINLPYFSRSVDRTKDSRGILEGGEAKHGNPVTASFLNINATKLTTQFTLSLYQRARGIFLYLPPALLVFNLNVLVASARSNIRRLRIGLRF